MQGEDLRRIAGINSVVQNRRGGEGGEKNNKRKIEEKIQRVKYIDDNKPDRKVKSKK